MFQANRRNLIVFIIWRMLMSANPNPQPKLKVVPPKSEPKSPSYPSSAPPQPTPPSTTPESQQKRSKFNGKKWAILGAIAIGLVGVSTIDIGHKIPGEGRVESTPNQRRTIKTSEASTIEAIYVKNNEFVDKNDRLVKLSSDALEDELFAIDQEIAKTESNLDSARYQHSVAVSQLDEAKLRYELASQRERDSHLDFQRSQSNNPPPEIQEIHGTRSMLEQEIINLQKERDSQKNEFERFQSLVDEGAMGELSAIRAKSKLESIKGDLEIKKRELQRLQSRVATARDDISQEYYDRQDKAAEARSQVETARQEMTVAKSKIQELRNTFNLLRQEKQRLLQEQRNLILTAPISGVVQAKDLDRLLGQTLLESQELMKIIDLDNLTAVVYIEEADRKSVEPGMKVIYIPTGETREYEATVLEVGFPEPDKSQNKNKVPVRIQFKQLDSTLALGTSGTAKIDVGEIRLYEKIGQQLYRPLQPLIDRLRG